MRNVLIVCLCLFFSAQKNLAYASFTIEQLNKLTQSPAFLKGQFKQTKYLKDFDVHLNSNGNFDYTQDSSVHWHTIEPIENLLTMTPNSIVSSQGEEQLLDMQAKNNPVVIMLSDVFFSVIAAKWENLHAYFTITGAINDNDWEVVLQAKDQTLSQVILRVELTGNDYLRHVKFFEKNGDRTSIAFTHLSLGK